MTAERTVLVLGAGNSGGLNFTRCLHLAGGWRVVGVDYSMDGYHSSCADDRHLIRCRGEGDLVTLLGQLVERHRPDLLYAGDTGPALDVVSRRRGELAAPVFLPDEGDHRRMEDKWSTWQALDVAGIPLPDTALADGPGTVETMLGKHGRVWLRRRAGSAGSGAVATTSLRFARAWLDREDGWGTFTVAECLTPRSVTFSGLWHEGALIASQLRERLGWKYGSLTASGVTGITGAQRTVWDRAIHERAVACVRALAARPHGAIGVDFTFDGRDRALPTEVQPARFYTSTLFMAHLGLNLPDLYCRTALDGPPPGRPLINPIREQHYWIKRTEDSPQLLSAAKYFAAPMCTENPGTSRAEEIT